VGKARAAASRLALLIFLALVLLGGVVPLMLLLSRPEVPIPEMGDRSFESVTLVEPGVGRREGVRLELVDGRIHAAKATQQPSGSGEFAGAFVLPGLIDLHVHHPPGFALGGREVFGLLFLAHGVTSVRDTGSLWGDAIELAEASRQGEFAGPRVFACGPLLSGVVPAAPGMRFVQGAEDARVAVAELRARGADCVKLHNGLSREIVVATIAEADERGLPVVAHVAPGQPLADMRGAEVQHLMQVSPHWSRVRRDAVDRYVSESVAARIPHTPTLVVFERVSLRAQNEPPHEAARWLPRYMREVLWSASQNPAVTILDQSVGSSPGDRIARMKEVTRQLYAAGVPLQLGTDTPNPGVVPGASLRRELALLVEAGVPLEAAWQAGTRAAGLRLGVPKLGSLEVGAPADLLFFREDPTRSLAALESLTAVMVGGRLYRSAALEAALEQHRQYFASPVYDGLSSLLARSLLRFLGPAPLPRPGP
jgi:imidazolonepropionase-like amidohydrolase